MSQFPRIAPFKQALGCRKTCPPVRSFTNHTRVGVNCWSLGKAGILLYKAAFPWP